MIGKYIPYGIVSRNNAWHEFRRGIFVVSTERRQGRHRKTKNEKKDMLDSFLTFEKEKKIENQEREYRKKLEELQLLTRSVASMIRHKEKRLETATPKSDIESVDNESRKVYEALEEPKNEVKSHVGALKIIDRKEHEFTPSKHSLFIPAVNIPSSIAERLGLALRYLVSKDKQNWGIVIQQLQDAGGFKDLPKKDVRHFIYQIPPKGLRTIISPIFKMLEEAGIQMNTNLMNTMIKSLSHGSIVSDETLQKIESICDVLRSKNKGKLSRDTSELLITAYGKRGDIDKVNQLLLEMKNQGLSPSKTALTNILATCVYKTNDHQQAVQIFDSMKFLSQTTKPGEKAYQDIIVSYVNNDNVEKALDLYHEMLKDGVQLNQKILIALARGCASRSSLKMKAWDFVFEIYKHNWEPSLQTFEYILYLSAKDGDIALTRSLFSKLNKSRAVTARSFSFLLLAYSRSYLKNNSPSMTYPSIIFHEQGKIFRRNLLNDHDVVTHEDDPRYRVPFLPVLDLTSKEEIIAESSAIWSHANIYNPDFINIQSVNTYLNIAAELGSLTEFRNRYESCSFLDRAGLPFSDKIVIEEPDEIKEESLTEDTTSTNIEKNNSHSTKSNEFDDENLVTVINPRVKSDSTKKVKRSSITYVIALKAAGRAKTYRFAQSIWSERGLYRKTNDFKNLSRKEKDTLDFEFAAAMVNCLTNMKLLDDAIAILLSTEYQFRWSWNELDDLNKACIEAGDDKSSKSIRAIVRRAQVNYEGKIRKKDYKRYVLERGY